MYKSIGIDFGTSESSVFALVKGTPKVIFSRTKGRSTPSVVAVNNDRISVGDIRKPGAAPDLKRIIGLPYHDSVVERYMKDFQIKLEKTTDRAVTVSVNGKQLRVEEVVALLFRDLTHDLKKVELAAITVPASFGIIRRRAIKDAAAITGFCHVELIDETTAAAIEFAMKIKDNAHLRENRSLNPKETTLIFQLGGGTIDVAIFKITTKSVTLQGSASSCELGGLEFDRNLLEYLIEKAQITVEDSNRAERMKLCKEAKNFLTSAEIFTNENVETIETITKTDFETANKDLVKTIGAMVDLAMQAAGLEKVDEYILIGKGSGIPYVKDMIEYKLGKENRIQILDICEAAARGAAICAENMRLNSTRRSLSRKKKRIAKIQWNTDTHPITIKGNQIVNTHGIKEAEELW